MALEEEEKEENNNNMGGSGEGNVQCPNHPLNKNGGICAFCLQEKLAKLLLSSSISILPSSSSNSCSPSFRSTNQHSFPIATNHSQYHSNNRSRIPFIIFTHNQKKKKMKDIATRNSHSDHNNMVFKRSNSVSTPAQPTHNHRRFWSFLFSSNPIKIQNSSYMEDNANSFNGKVSRSRSLGCGSRSFSGDFFDRISTGFADCTLRRVESQREPKLGHDRVRCGGLFSGFSIASSSSTNDNLNGKRLPVSVVSHRRSMSWGWAFASPIKALSSKRETAAAASNKNNLCAIPSLLAVRS